MADYQIFVDGAEGTTGLRIRERLAQRDECALLALPEERRKDPEARLRALLQADVSILCLPDAAAREIVQAAGGAARICDTSTAHRTHPGWVYGFPELGGRRGRIAAAGRVAVPGCHATGFLALAAPLVEMEILPSGLPLACHSLTGYSGGGKKMIAAYRDESRPASYDAPRLYALGMAHKHLPEMQAVSGLSLPPLFCPVVADYYSGMLVTLPLPLEALAPGRQSLAAVAQALQEYYAGQPLVTVHAPGGLPADGTLSPIEMSGRDSLEIFITGSETQLLLSARFDNLGKGASGAAVQCMNLMLGLPEETGLCL